MSFTPVIIIGAGRSGTNILRDTLVSLPGVGTWPCDEINYIWRHGNVRFPTDEFSPQMAMSGNKKMIRHAFDRLAKKHNISHIVEKTCANSLRVGFVDQIIPDAKYIFIIRDGRDVVASAMKRWAAPLDLPYILRKARYVPLGDMPYYSFRFTWNRLYRFFSGKQRLAFWGPRFEGMDEALHQYPLAGVCALQWRRCVEKAEEDFLSIDPGRIHRISYESFVRQPKEELFNLVRFLGLNISESLAIKAIENIRTDSVGRWKEHLSIPDQELVNSLAGPVIARYGY